MVSKKKNHLIMFAQSLEQPRIVKRIVEKSHEYDQVDVFGFKRQIHAVKNYGVLEEHDNIKLNFVGTVADGLYLKRVWAYVKLLWLIFKKYGFRSKNLYVFGMDLRIIGSLVINKKIDYEISDILWLHKKPFLRFFLQKIDKYLASKSNRVIFTSKGFYLKHYKEHVSQKKAVIKENKFKIYGRVMPIDKIKTDALRMAYIGAFRYENIIDSLLEIFSKNGEAKLNFYGDGKGNIVSKMKEYAKKYENISFNGPFKNPDDLEKIYAENNLNFVVYDNTLENERVAMPNKYYESGYFNIPIVSAKNTYVGERVIKNGMGWVSNIEKKDIEEFLDSLSIDDLELYHNKIKTLNKSQFAC